MNSQPNFLLIMTDQQCFDQLACHGNSAVKTPNIDKLFARGTSLNGMYTATPICMPNRQAMLTIRMGSINGGHSNGIPLDQDNTTFPELLQAAGYYTALIGKSHLQNMTEESAYLGGDEPPEGLTPPPVNLQNARKSNQKLRTARYHQERSGVWNENEDHEPYSPYYGFDDLIFASRHGEIAGFHHQRHLEAADPAIRSRTGRSQALKGIEANPQTYASALTPEEYPTSFVGEQTATWLEHHADERDNTPFFLWCSFPDPHHPWTPPLKYYEMYDPADVELPDSFHESPRTQTEFLRWCWEREQVNGRRPRMPFMADEAEARQILATTYGMITFIDEQVGRIMAQLEESGLAENTVIIFTSDHGDYMGHHGLFLKGPVHYQTLIKVPFIWCDCEGQYSRGSIDALASYLDIGRTILERAGLASFQGCQGRSLLPLLAGETDVHRQQVLVEHVAYSPKFGIPEWTQVRTLVTGRYRLSIYTHSDEGELYDLRADPGEIVNLWHSEQHLAIRAQLLFSLTKEMALHADRSRVPETLA